MRTTLFSVKPVIFTMALLMTFSCQKENSLIESQNQTNTESRLRFAQPTCTSVLGTEWDTEIILNGPEYLIKAMYNEGIKPPVDFDRNSRWELVSTCADAYISFSPDGGLFVEAAGYDNYTLEEFMTKIVSNRYENGMTTVIGKKK